MGKCVWNGGEAGSTIWVRRFFMATFIVGVMVVGIVGFSAGYIYFMNREIHGK